MRPVSDLSHIRQDTCNTSIRTARRYEACECHVTDQESESLLSFVKETRILYR